jgi:four helix bundle protein
MIESEFEDDVVAKAARSARSVVLNIAEGSGKTGRARRHSYTVALGEAGEACAAIRESEIAIAIENVIVFDTVSHF